jgi:5,10-methylene-tetrahydrofolate dehydrogenase/methenyl tetrahydrofolate cyclohydrolase
LLGKAIAQPIHNKVAHDVSQKYGKVHALAIIILGVKEYFQTYVRMKRKACAKVGLKSINADLPGDVSEENLLDAVLDLKVDHEVHGILVQLPLLPHINEKKI